MPCNTNNIGYLRDYEKKKEKSVLYKHKMLDHKNEEPQFEMEITGIFRDALTRQANEAVRIQKTKPSETLNSKCEFNSAPVARITDEKQKKGISKPTGGSIPRLIQHKNIFSYWF